MLQRLTELGKLAEIFQFVGSQAVASARGEKTASHLLTELYLEALGNKSQLKRETLSSVLPETRDAVFEIYGRAHPMIVGGFADREAQTSSNEICALAAITRSLNPKHILEIGTAHGGSTYQFFLNAPDAEITTVDLDPPKLKDENIARAFASSRIRVVTHDSRTFDFSSLEKKFDLIFIDGGHDTESVKSDSLKAMEVLNDGGVILWHDYKPSFPEVFAFLNEFAAQYEISHVRGTSIAVYKSHRVNS